MTPDDVRAAAERLIDFHERFAPLFGKEQAQDHAYDYLKGLMVCRERKSIEPIALLVGHGDVSGLQKFVGAGQEPLGQSGQERPRGDRRPGSGLQVQMIIESRRPDPVAGESACDQALDLCRVD